ncbi:MAG: hypothetical protein BIFFINMI_01225 [Phycisphaerae bacterium]|nr:hypothetical protein [Phycisphaerae bacterium]
MGNHACAGAGRHFRFLASVWIAATALASATLGGCAKGPPQYEWARLQTPLTTAVGQMAVVDGRLFVLGGLADNNTHRNALTDAICSFDPASGHWKKHEARLPYPHLSAGGGPVVIGKRIILSPGFGPTVNGGWGAHNHVIEYDVQADKAVETAAYPHPAIWGCLMVATATEGRPRVFSLGGWNGGPVGTVFEYDLDKRTLSPVTSADAQPNYLQTFAACPDGRVAVFRSRLDPWAAEWFDPVRGTARPAAGKPAEAIGGWGLAWPDGNGGVLIADTRAGRVARFDPKTGAFAPAAVTLPNASEGFEMGTSAAAPGGRTLYISEQRWDQDHWTVNLIVGRRM